MVRVSGVKRGAAVKWIQLLGYGAESYIRSRVPGWALPHGDRKTISVNPAEKGYLFQIREG